MFVVLLWRVLGVPLSWAKIQGGRRLTWIGYEVQLDTLSLGISEGRARWAIEWLLRVSRDGVADVAEFRSALGRLSFVVGALEWEKPFLAPMFNFCSRHKRGGLQTVPLYIRIVTKFLAERIQRRRMYPSALLRSKDCEAFRVDAKAEGDCIGVGGWLPTRGKNGELSTAASPWFSLELTRESAPWAYHRGEPFRAIAALEALGALLGVMAFRKYYPVNTDTTVVLPGIGDNRGNKYALSRLQSTKFPLGCVTMELACQLEQLGARLSMEWAPREKNVEADRLSNSDFTGFTLENRIVLEMSSIRWTVLDRFMELGRGFSEEQLVQTKTATRQTKRAKLREREPW